MKRFSTEFPSPTVPTLPEYFKKDTLAGLTPGQVVFPYAHVLKSDLNTSLLYVRTSSDVDADAHDPKYFGERAGIMRLFEQIDGELVDGFIADCRYLKPGSIWNETIHVPDDGSPYNQKVAADNAHNFKPLLAGVFADPDGTPHFIGDPALTSHIEALMTESDAYANKTNAPAVQATEAKAVAHIAIVGPEYYHG